MQDGKAQWVNVIEKWKKTEFSKTEKKSNF